MNRPEVIASSVEGFLKSKGPYLGFIFQAFCTSFTPLALGLTFLSSLFAGLITDTERRNFAEGFFGCLTASIILNGIFNVTAFPLINLLAATSILSAATAATAIAQCGMVLSTLSLPLLVTAYIAERYTAGGLMKTFNKVQNIFNNANERAAGYIGKAVGSFIGACAKFYLFIRPNRPIMPPSGGYQMGTSTHQNVAQGLNIELRPAVAQNNVAESNTQSANGKSWSSSSSNECSPYNSDSENEEDRSPSASPFSM